MSTRSRFEKEAKGNSEMVCPVVDARGRLLSTREAEESHEEITESDYSFLSAYRLLKYIHNSTGR